MSSYLDHLPAVLRTEFLGRFLQAFEDVLHGARDPGHPPQRRPGLAELIDDLDPYLYPDDRTPEDFLPWLAGWVALRPRAGWDRATTVRFIQESVPLYRRRGTLAGLHRMLEIHLGHAGSVITDGFDQIPHYFQVRLVLADPAEPVTAAIAGAMRSDQETARAIIDLEKPAHTFYALKVVVPTMRLPGAEPLVLGQNTLLGTRPERHL